MQYPNNSGSIEDYREFTEQAHAVGCKVAVAADILSLALLVPPGDGELTLLSVAHSVWAHRCSMEDLLLLISLHVMNTNEICRDV